MIPFCSFQVFEQEITRGLGLIANGTAASNRLLEKNLIIVVMNLINIFTNKEK